MCPFENWQYMLTSDFQMVYTMLKKLLAQYPDHSEVIRLLLTMLKPLPIPYNFIVDARFARFVQ